ncbi:2-aminoethylphosphonate--pyruvate transaminase-like [Pollicipes pollicipes]|uniref:2-aminoethylphosphonate--pyruvate transaminase-like n=1 Tax=Pollicipes pollicipes TaxID=41117 RepID=UPI00188548C5|nr:2-aminoethylphosphonate--pyruvate transaminase-like [Pollicipes pollicipes]
MLVLCNGAYGRRMEQICRTAGIACETFNQSEEQALSPAAAAPLLAAGPLSAVAMVHCETSSGVLNPVAELGRLVRQLQPGAAFIVDSMSAFGAVPLDLEAAGVDYLVSSANKCIEGVPGFGFVIARLERLKQTKGNSRSLSLDLFDQWAGLERSGQFRFTPPTHALLAFDCALQGLLSAGGVAAQASRYRANNVIVKRGLRRLGFRPLVRDGDDCYIITVIYPGKVTDADCFRIGNIGDLHEPDMHRLVDCVETVLRDMQVPIPVTYGDPQ